MRLDPLLDSFALLGALWGAPAPQVCSSAPLPPAGAWTPPLEAPAAATAFIDVTVVPMDTERVLPNYTVVVTNGRITAMGPASQTPVPAGAVRVDGRGKYLMPGLADMHLGPAHAIDSPREGQEKAFADLLFLRYTAHGVTALRSLGGSPPQAVQQLRTLAAEYPIPRLYLGLERPLSLPTTPGSAAAAIANFKAAGYSLLIDDQVQTDSATMAALRRHGFPIGTHSHPLSFDKVLKLGLAGGSVEHLYLFWDSLLGRSGPPGINPTNLPPAVDVPLEKVPAMVSEVVRAGVWVVPSLRCMETAHPYVKGDAFAQIVKILQDSSVKMLLGGDGWAISRWSVQKELAAMVRAGLTPYQTLRMGTRNVAEYFGRLDSAGTVAVGKEADLILANGNPLEDVRHTWIPAGVMINGRWLDRQALDQRLLAAPRFWFEELLRPLMPGPILNMEGILPFMSTPPRPLEQWRELERRSQRVFTLVDSLNPANRQMDERVLPLLTAELGAIRAMMTPDEAEAFDWKIPVWLRDQAQRGYTVTIPGVQPVP